MDIKKKWSLALFEQKELNPLEIYSSNNVQQILDAISAEVQGSVVDVSTPKGRQRIKHLARQVSSSKVVLDRLGQKLHAEQKAEIKLVNLERQKIKKFLDLLRDKVREPLTAWEQEEEARIQEEELKKQILIAWEAALIEDKRFDEMFDRAREIERREQEIQRKERELLKVEQERLDKIKAEEEVRKLKDREKLIAENAIKQAELETQQKLQEAERRRIEDIEKAKAEIHLKQREKEAEKLRIEKEAQEISQDKEHRRKIDDQISYALTRLGITDDHARVIITNIKRDAIANLKINY